MIKRFIESMKVKRELRKTYKNAQMICIIHGANIISNVNDIVEKIKQSIDNNENILGSVSKDDLGKVFEFMNLMNSDEFQKTVVESIINKEK